MAKSSRRIKSRRASPKPKKSQSRKRISGKKSKKPKSAIPKRTPRMTNAMKSFDWFEEMYPNIKLSSDVLAYIKQVNIDARDLLDVAQGIAFHRDGRNVIELDDLMEAKKRDVYLNNVFPDRPMTRTIPVPDKKPFEDGIEQFTNMFPRILMTEDVYEYLKKINSSANDTFDLLNKARDFVELKHGVGVIDMNELMEAKKKQ